MEALQALKTRRAVRAYRDEPVAREVLADLVDCGRLAATAINIQPWEFVVVTDRALLTRIAGAAEYGRFIAGAAACIVVLSKDTKYYLEDGSAATQNILVAARAHGLGACWVAGDKKDYGPEICRLVGAPDGFRLISLVPVGHPAEDPRKDKRPLSEVLHWERF
jgi:nitroreductase